MERYLIKLNDLSEKNRYLFNTISQIEEDVSNLNALKNNIKWTGPANEKFLLKHNEYMDSLNKMLSILNSCLRVTEKFQENYTDGYHEIVTNVQKIEEEIEEKDEYLNLDDFNSYQENYDDMEGNYE